MSISRKCWNCGGTIDPVPHATHQKFCSKECRAEYKKKKKQKMYFEPFTFTCAKCGKEVLVDDPDDRRSRFCSKECEKRYWKHPHKKGVSHDKESN